MILAWSCRRPFPQARSIEALNVGAEFVAGQALCAVFIFFGLCHSIFATDAEGRGLGLDEREYGGPMAALEHAARCNDVDTSSDQSWSSWVGEDGQRQTAIERQASIELQTPIRQASNWLSRARGTHERDGEGRSSTFWAWPRETTQRPKPRHRPASVPSMLSR